MKIDEDVFIMHEKKLEFSWWEKNKEMTIINWWAWYYTIGTFGKKSDP